MTITTFKAVQLSDAIAIVRQNADDTATSHRMAPDDLGEYVDGIRKVFPLARKNIVSGTGKYIADGGTLTTLNPSDAAFGILTLTSAPTKTLEYFYNYQNFTDTEIQMYIDQALTEMDMDETVFSTNGTIPSTIPPALYNAMCFFAAAYAIGTLMERFAENFNSTAEGVALEQSEIYKAYKASYDRNIKEATRIRGEFWGNQTRSNRAVTAVSRMRYPGNRQMPHR